MLIRLIVAAYPLLLEISLWLTLAVASIAGYEATVPLIHSAGAIPEPEFGWKIAGALAFSVIAFLSLAVVTGPLLMLVDIRRAVRSIEAKARAEASSSLLFERKEPT